jgi:hypothetical protein
VCLVTGVCVCVCVCVMKQGWTVSQSTGTQQVEEADGGARGGPALQSPRAGDGLEEGEESPERKHLVSFCDVLLNSMASQQLVNSFQEAYSSSGMLVRGLLLKEHILVREHILVENTF